ncbi:putative damage-inducible protein DinB [Scopulibacillus darangshiensis]|uniref:Putative damage-inducible protein DinB n=1 Tax=Scopulibacillus darangshiensis TaxID=442528 RepID=A0A4R2P8K8_9BACL|nr:DinB family protein [Scopulibacillus darangshiensis]TCP31299.1 putative damage-inducible protein DinB [Scopulibacillus darangshiensis]
MDTLIKQYDWVRLTRESLFQYCETMTPEEYIQELKGFGWGSIRNLHAHVAECYHYWLGHFALKNDMTPVEPHHVNNVQEMRQVFEGVNNLTREFLQKFEGKWGLALTRRRHDEEATFTILWLYTHTITHEFHHKGQIVSMGRQLGHIPPDTDLIEPVKD